MRTKATLALDLLEQELEVLGKEQQVRIVGGNEPYYAYDSNGNKAYYRWSESDPWTSLNNLNEVTIRPGSSNGEFVGGQYGNPPWNDGGGGYTGGGGSSGSSQSGYYTSNGYSSNGYSSNGYYSSNGNTNGIGRFTDVQEQVSFAIAHGLAWKEAYSAANLAFAGRLDTATVLSNIVTNDVTSDLNLSNMKGVGIVNAAGKLLGISSAFFAAEALVTDLRDGDGQASAYHWADAGISIGSLFIKSNIVGFAVSGGWLLIKGEFE